MTTIATARLKLRPLTMADAPVIARLGNDFAIARMTGRMPHPYRLVHARAFIASLHGGRELAYAIVGPGGFAGCCGKIPLGDGMVEFGYWLGRPYWGCGIAGEMAAGLIAFLFADGATDEVRASHFDDNVASKRLILRQGFAHVGTDFAWCAARAAHVPCLRYTLTRERWQQPGSRP